MEYEKLDIPEELKEEVKNQIEKDILNLKIEDLKTITEDRDVQNIIILRECIKNHNTIEYFNYIQTKQGEEEN